jgi:pimeloyl-ACP methyl ester carboxylesterase
MPVILLHGWPSDPHYYDEAAPVLAADGCRVLLPWLRGFGPTRFLDPATPRSGQQAALGVDLHDFMDGLDIKDPILVGYDWGGRAACVAAAQWPARVRGLVSVNGYNIQHIPSASRPGSAAQEHRYWYQCFVRKRPRIFLSKIDRTAPIAQSGSGSPLAQRITRDRVVTRHRR